MLFQLFNDSNSFTEAIDHHCDTYANKEDMNLINAKYLKILEWKTVLRITQ